MQRILIWALTFFAAAIGGWTSGMGLQHFAWGDMALGLAICGLGYVIGAAQAERDMPAR